MPRFYEEAAHLLLLIVAHGVVIAPGVDHQFIVRRLAIRLEQILTEQPTHADAAISVLDGLSASRLASFDAGARHRLVALAGTAIGNLMTMRNARR